MARGRVPTFPLISWVLPDSEQCDSDTVGGQHPVHRAAQPGVPRMLKMPKMPPEGSVWRGPL
jgi:hypothetical protein